MCGFFKHAHATPASAGWMIVDRKFRINFENSPFLQTSKTWVHPNRLNWRCEILLTRNQEAIEGKRILDLASHDGRFSNACLELGASHVSGVEGRQHLVEFARENLKDLGHNPKNFRFVRDDVFDYLPNVKPKEFDTVLCFGFFYHTIRQIELLRELKRIQPKYIVLDTSIMRGVFIPALARIVGHTLERVRGERACLLYRLESNVYEGATIDPIGLVAWPTKNFIELIFKHHGFSLKPLSWKKREIRDWTDIKDYKTGFRVSYIAQQLRAQAD